MKKQLLFLTTLLVLSFSALKASKTPAHQTLS